MSVLMNIGCCFTAPGGNRTPDNPAPETGALSTELQTHWSLHIIIYLRILSNIFLFWFPVVQFYVKIK